jgi:hypothetical protein
MDVHLWALNGKIRHFCELRPNKKDQDAAHMQSLYELPGLVIKWNKPNINNGALIVTGEIIGIK